MFNWKLVKASEPVINKKGYGVLSLLRLATVGNVGACD